MAGRDPGIVVVKMSSLGDIVHALGAVSILVRRGFSVRWVVKSRYISIFRGVEGVEPVVPTVSSLISLRKKRLKYGFDLQGLLKSASILFVSGASVRAGFAYPHLKEKLSGIFYNVRIDVSSRIHIVERMRQLIVSTLDIEDDDIYDFLIDVTEDEIKRSYSIVNEEDFIVLLVSGSWISKKLSVGWATSFVEKAPFKVFIMTGLEDKDNFMNSALKDITICPSNLRDAMAIIKRAKAVVGPDTGFLHIACAFNKPVVGIYGPTDPLRNGPFRTKSVIVTPQCINIGCWKSNCERCTSLVNPEDVAKALANLLL